MNKQQKEIIITSILVVIFIIVLIIQFKPKPRPKPKPPAAKTAAKPPLAAVPPKPPVKKEPTTSLDKKILKLQEEQAQADWGRDPFFRVAKKEHYLGAALHLKGVSLAKGKRPYAFINDLIVTVGDTIGDYVVVKIEKNRVLLKRGVEKFYIALPEE